MLGVQGPNRIKSGIFSAGIQVRSGPALVLWAPPRRLSPSGTHEYASKSKIFKGAGATRRSLPGAARPVPVPSPRPGPLRLCPSLRAEAPPACLTNYPTKSVSPRTCSRPHRLRVRWEPVQAADAGHTQGAQDPLNRWFGAILAARGRMEVGVLAPGERVVGGCRGLRIPACPARPAAAACSALSSLG